ncbi:MAG: acyl-CoA dehydrogenase family protein [Myxococcota bacterium]|nr:acyl-CoA dehydrogenase family protein [Myxococcota bacterium]
MTPLYARIRDASPKTQMLFPQEQIDWCAQDGLFHRYHEGSPNDRLKIFLDLSSACLCTAFVLTQFMGALSRIATYAPNRKNLLQSLLSGEKRASVGISQLSTSGRHRPPPLTATLHKKHIALRGRAPWVTGAAHTDYILIGAHQSNQKNALFLVSTDSLTVSPPSPLSALNGSKTTSVLVDLSLPYSERIHEETTPSIVNVASKTSSALALGLAGHALERLEKETQHRPLLQPALDALSQRWEALQVALFEKTDTVELRYQVNRLALDSTQTLLLATKGKGYSSTHTASRLYQEAHFFLVWSCPAPVVQRHLDACAFAATDRSNPRNEIR